MFLESRPDFDWHPGMLLEARTLQTPFMADLVTLADPTSPYSFLNYLKEIGQLYSFYIRENFYPLRSEYNDYCRWAAAQAEQRCASAARCTPSSTTATPTSCTRPARDLPRPPPRARHRHPAARPGGRRGSAACHNSDYLDAKDELQAKPEHHRGRQRPERRGDLLRPARRRSTSTATGSTGSPAPPRFFPLEYTKLTLEMTSPEYMDYFHALPPPVRDRLEAEQEQLFKGIDAS